MKTEKSFHGKAIYNPSGKAGEYSYWAANFYNGCSARCEYCYNRHGRSAKILGADIPTLKKCLKDEQTAQMYFRKEVDQNLEELQKHGLFFNFVSDPCLHETWRLNSLCMRYCIIYDIPVKILTKQTWWIDDILDEIQENDTIWNVYNAKRLFQIGFTLTGHDELEPGAESNAERIRAMKVLNSEGFKTWASIEPIIDLKSSAMMIKETSHCCEFYKIGLKSGGKYSKNELIKFILDINMAFSFIGTPIYWKDSILKQAGIERKDLPSNCVTRDFNI
jgi:DNA repair photolyase